MNESLKTKSILKILVILTVLIVGTYVFLFYYINRTNDTITGVAGKLKEISISQAKLTAVERVLADTAAQSRQIDSFVISSDGTVGFIEMVENLAGSAGLSVSIDSVDTKAAAGTMRNDWEYLNLTISVKGNWAGVFNYLSMLERLPYLAEINSVAIQQTTNSAQNIPGVKNSTAYIWQGQFSISVLKFKSS